jgi:hypothetical protein
MIDYMIEDKWKILEGYWVKSSNSFCPNRRQSILVRQAQFPCKNRPCFMCTIHSYIFIFLHYVFTHRNCIMILVISLTEYTAAQHSVLGVCATKPKKKNSHNLLSVVLSPLFLIVFLFLWNIFLVVSRFFHQRRFWRHFETTLKKKK